MNHVIRKLLSGVVLHVCSRMRGDVHSCIDMRAAQQGGSTLKPGNDDGWPLQESGILRPPAAYLPVRSLCCHH